VVNATDAASLLQRIDALEREVRRHRDVLEIHAVLARYSRALDWLDDDMLATVFYDDAEVDFGFFKGSGRDFRAQVMPIERSFGRRWHCTGQVTIDLQGDLADVEVCGISLSAEFPDSVPAGNLSHFYGYYLDRFARRNGRWGIVRRKFVLVSTTSMLETQTDGPLAVIHKTGATSTSHPDYRPLGKAGPLGTSGG
jgi:hypothetical protein